MKERMWFLPEKRYQFVGDRDNMDQIAIINEIFNEYDSNGDNLLDKTEIKTFKNP
jgi:hypothetical protein